MDASILLDPHRVWRRRVLKLLLKLACLAPFIFLFSSSASAQSYELRGRTYEERLDGRGAVATATSAGFSVFVSNCQWVIESELPNRPGYPDRRRVSSLNDGQIRSLFIPNTDGLQPKVTIVNGVARTQSVMKTHIQAIVTSNVVLAACNEGEVFVSHLWLMFASGCYLAEKAGQEIAPIYDINACASFHKDLTQPADWMLTETEPHLPAFVAYMNTRGIFAGKTTNGVMKYLPLRPPYNQGYTNALYAVTGWTNVENLVLPTGFTYHLFEPVGGGKSKDDLRVIARAFGIITNFSTAHSAAGLSPELPVNSVVVDRRLMHAKDPIEIVTYSGNAGVISTEQARKVHKRDARRRMFEHLPRWLPVLVVTVAVLPMTILVFRHFARRRSNDS